MASGPQQPTPPPTRRLFPDQNKKQTKGPVLAGNPKRKGKGSGGKRDPAVVIIQRGEKGRGKWKVLIKEFLENVFGVREALGELIAGPRFP